MTQVEVLDARRDASGGYKVVMAIPYIQRMSRD